MLTQGLNRQIRRMCEYLGYEVVTLKRTRIMNVTLKGLKVGQWRHLTEQEMAEINNSIADSGKTEERSIDENKQPTQARAKQKPRNEEEKKRDFSKYVKKARNDAKQGQSRSKAGNPHSSKPNQTKRSSTKRTGTLSLKK